MADKVYRVGIVGCGGMGRSHANAWTNQPRAEVVATADMSADSAKALADQFDARSYDDYNKMFADEELDIVSVTTWQNVRAEITVAAAEAGIPGSFGEKPMAESMGGTWDMIEACEKNGVALQVGFVRRYDNNWGTLKRVVESGELGTPLVWRQISGGPAPARPFFMEKMEGGGPLIDGMVHNYDFACHCFGAPKEVKCNPTKIRHDTTAIDTGTVLAEFERGDQIVVSWTWGLPPDIRTNSATEVMGTNGILFFPGSFPAAKAEGKHDPATQGAYLLLLAGGEEKVVTFEKNNMFRDELVHFADWVTNGGTPLASCDEGIASTRIAELAMGGGGLC